MASFDASIRFDRGRREVPRSERITGISRRAARRVAAIVSRGGLVVLFLVFAWANFAHWRSTGQPSGLGTTFLEGWVALMFLIRRPPRELSVRALAWIAAPIGSFAMLLARPTDGGLSHLDCEILQFLGVLVALVSIGVLGRSFGIVAANRGVKTGGPYRLVRHPAYAGYLISYSAYVAENPSLANIGLLFLSTAFQFVRIREEERVLRGDAAYERYRASVRYRLIPLVY
jgi:protein-S-isoprenylcysteine O-methyltransferase Ste14